MSDSLKIGGVYLATWVLGSDLDKSLMVVKQREDGRYEFKWVDGHAKYEPLYLEQEAISDLEYSEMYTEIYNSSLYKALREDNE